MRLKTAQLGFMGESPILDIKTTRVQPSPEWLLEDIEGLRGDPGTIFEVEENPNGGDYVSVTTGRKPSRPLALSFKVVSSKPYELFKAEEKISSIAKSKKLLSLVVTEDFGVDGIVTTTLDNCRLSGEILVRISGVVLECEIGLVAQKADKRLSTDTAPGLDEFYSDFNTTVSNIENYTSSNKYPTQQQLNAQKQQSQGNAVTVTLSGYSATVKIVNTQLGLTQTESITFAPTEQVLNIEMGADLQQNMNIVYNALQADRTATLSYLNSLKVQTHFNNVAFSFSAGSVVVTVTNAYSSYIASDSVVIPDPDNGEDFDYYASVYADTSATIAAIDAAYGPTVDHEILWGELQQYIPNPLGHPDTMISISVNAEYIVVAGTNPNMVEPIFLNLLKPVYTPAGGGGDEDGVFIPGTKRYTLVKPFNGVTPAAPFFGMALDTTGLATSTPGERFRFEAWKTDEPDNKFIWDFTFDSVSGNEIHIAYWLDNGNFLETWHPNTSGMNTLVQFPGVHPFGNLTNYTGSMTYRLYLDDRTNRPADLYTYDEGIYHRNITADVPPTDGGGSSDQIEGMDKYTYTGVYSGKSYYGTSVYGFDNYFDGERFRFEMWKESDPSVKAIYDLTMDRQGGSAIGFRYDINGANGQKVQQYPSGINETIPVTNPSPLGDLTNYSGNIVHRVYKDKRSTRTLAIYDYTTDTYLYPTGPDAT
jgi:hypothetical protein